MSRFHSLYVIFPKGIHMKKLIGYLLSIAELRKTRLTVKRLQKDLDAVRQYKLVAPPRSVETPSKPTPTAKPSVPPTPVAPPPAKPSVPSTPVTPPTGPTVPSISILQADDYHLNDRNFTSLFGILRDKKVRVRVGVQVSGSCGAMIKACGVYHQHLKHISGHLETVSRLDKEELRKWRYHNVDIATCAIDEALSAVIMEDHWQERSVPKDFDILFDRLWESNKETLLHCCAAAAFWVDYWRRIDGLHTFNVALVFSGSYIYGRVLLKLLTYTQAKCFVLESFASGYDYFFEERHQPIANNSRINHSTYYRSLLQTLGDQDKRNRDVVRAFNKMRSMKNKNVTQPNPGILPASIRGKCVSVVLGQVVNDFSLISGKGTVLCSIPAYKELIATLLESDNSFVIFKAHPWEMKKQNLLSPYTEDALKEWAETLPDHQRSRLMIVGDWNLHQLLRISTYAISLCSQSALEAAVEGLKPVIVGGAFYDNGGFTSNFTSPREAALAINSGSLRGSLTLGEFTSFETFLATLLQTHLVNTDNSGRNKLIQRLTPYRPQGHVKTHQSELSVTSTFA